MDTALGFDLDAEIVGLIQREEVQVPPFPGVALKLIKLTSSENFGLDEVAKLISSDQVLTASVIRCANSAFYAGAMPAVTVLQAIQRIGAKNLVGVALTDALKSEAGKTGPLFLLRRTLWQRGVASAFVAQALAPHRGVTTADAFLAGLLHDFGELVALSCVEVLIARHPNAVLPEERWVEIIERYHVELGLVTAVRWQLPDLVSDAISGHHSGAASGSDNPNMVDLMICCDLVVPRILAEPHLAEAELGAIPGLDAKDVAALWKTIPQIPPLLSAFTGGEPTAPPPTEPSQIAVVAAPFLTPPIKDVKWKVTAKLGPATEESYQAEQISKEGLRLRGVTPLKERRALEIKLEPTDAPALSFWVQVRSCIHQGGEVLIELSPFALDRERAKQWSALVPRPERKLTGTPVPS